MVRLRPCWRMSSWNCWGSHGRRIAWMRSPKLRDLSISTCHKSRTSSKCVRDISNIWKSKKFRGCFRSITRRHITRKTYKKWPRSSRCCLEISPPILWSEYSLGRNRNMTDKWQISRPSLSSTTLWPEIHKGGWIISRRFQKQKCLQNRIRTVDPNHP